jgi:preprotein translocase subunit SecG
MILASFATAAITIGIVGVSVLMIGLILLQKNRGAGLSGAFGGVGGHTAFGTKTGDFLTWVTVALTSLFLLLNIIGNYAFEPTRITGGDAQNAGSPAGPAGAGAPVPIESAPTLPVGSTPVEISVPPTGQTVNVQVPAPPSGAPGATAPPSAAEPAPVPVPTTQPG